MTRTIPIRHILFPYDGSERGRQIVPYIRLLAERFGARVTIIGVVPPTFASVPAAASVHLRAGSEIGEWKRHLQTELDDAFTTEFGDLKVDRLAEGGDPALRIVDFAQHNDVDLIAMPTRGAGTFRAMLIGSVTAKVLHDARCPVWTATHTEQPPTPRVPQRILCAMDGSPNSLMLVRWAVDFAGAIGASLRLLHVVGPISDCLTLESESRLQGEIREIANVKVDKMLRSNGIETPLDVAVGQVAATVADDARRTEADLVIIDRGHMSEPFGRLRTHTPGIIQQSPCPVVSV